MPYFGAIAFGAYRINNIRSWAMRASVTNNIIGMIDAYSSTSGDKKEKLVAAFTSASAAGLLVDITGFKTASISEENVKLALEHIANKLGNMIDVYILVKDALDEKTSAQILGDDVKVFSDFTSIILSLADSMGKKFRNNEIIDGINTAVYGMANNLLIAVSHDNHFLDNFRNVDPLVINLQDDKRKIKDNGFTYFDHNGDGFAELTEWLTEGQGLLVIDVNGNGQIDDGSELFGNYTILKNGRKAADGFAALRESDGNRDGVIDTKDAVWQNLRLWLDDGDGITQEGELKTLEEVGISSLSLETMTDSDGKTIFGTFTRSDGTSGEMKDCLYFVNMQNAVAKELVSIPEEIATELYLPASGTLLSSWQFMAQADNEDLQNLLRDYQNSADKTEKSAILDEILFLMAGDRIYSTKRGKDMDARKLNVIEKYYGEKFRDGGKVDKWTGPILTDLYSNVKRFYEGWLSAQTTVADLFSEIALVFDEESETAGFDFSYVKAKIDAAVEADFFMGKDKLAEFANAMYSFNLADLPEYVEMCQGYIAQNDELALTVYSAGRNIFAGTGENDKLQSESSNAIIMGKEGNDTLRAHGNDVILSGGKGDDYLEGGWGDDTYVWEAGCGNDTIDNTERYYGTWGNPVDRGKDTLKFGGDVFIDMLSWQKDKNDLIATFADTGETLTIKDWYGRTFNRIDVLEFADGSYTANDIEQLAGITA